MSIEFTPHAVFDIDTAAEYLEVQRDEGGSRFRKDLERKLEMLDRFPESGELLVPPSVRHPGLRVTRLRKFKHYVGP